jgi:hypothetical protein
VENPRLPESHISETSEHRLRWSLSRSCQRIPCGRQERDIGVSISDAGARTFHMKNYEAAWARGTPGADRRTTKTWINRTGRAGDA